MTNDANWQGHENRRSHRLSLQIPVRIIYFVNEPARLVSDGITVRISAHGALLRLPWGVPVGRELRLQNASSQETETVRVAFVEYGGDGDFLVGVEFQKAIPTFWGVSFPPEDWSPSHPDAKQDVLKDQ